MIGFVYYAVLFMQPIEATKKYSNYYIKTTAHQPSSLIISNLLSRKLNTPFS